MIGSNLTWETARSSETTELHTTFQPLYDDKPLALQLYLALIQLYCRFTFIFIWFPLSNRSRRLRISFPYGEWRHNMPCHMLNYLWREKAKKKKKEQKKSAASAYARRFKLRWRFTGETASDWLCGSRRERDLNLGVSE